MNYRFYEGRSWAVLDGAWLTVVSARLWPTKGPWGETRCQSLSQGLAGAYVQDKGGWERALRRYVVHMMYSILIVHVFIVHGI